MTSKLSDEHFNTLKP